MNPNLYNEIDGNMHRDFLLEGKFRKIIKRCIGEHVGNMDETALELSVNKGNHESNTKRILIRNLALFYEVYTNDSEIRLDFYTNRPILLIGKRNCVGDKLKLMSRLNGYNVTEIKIHELSDENRINIFYDHEKREPNIDTLSI